jgi:hypothetical protein
MIFEDVSEALSLLPLVDDPYPLEYHLKKPKYASEIHNLLKV